MADFNNLEPPQRITNPGQPSGFREFPRMLYKWNAPGEFNLVLTVKTLDEQQQAVADGWALTPITAPPPKRKKDE